MIADRGAKQVRVTVRLPHALYEDLKPLMPTGGGYRHASWLIRKALTHYLTCPERQRADAEAQAELGALLAKRS